MILLMLTQLVLLKIDLLNVGLMKNYNNISCYIEYRTLEVLTSV